MATTVAPTAHPYRDTEVIDARAPRFNQGTVGVVAVIALLTGWWWLFGLLALQLTLGLRFGRRWCLPCVFYFEVVQPRLGEGPVEDSRPPRFANIVGATLLWITTVVSATGVPLAGTVLGTLVAVLALLAAATGLCAGCELYRLVSRLRGVRAGEVGAVDLGELGVTAGGVPAAAVTVVGFTHPLCSACRELAQRLARGDRPFVEVDVSKRPELAHRYHVAVVPTAFAVAGDGTVLERLA
ncbi:MAG TPA: DUF4395 family protein [Actinomycetes bacterium]|nr:DUF4395 family protein [Actinomycetes bacterium]